MRNKAGAILVFFFLLLAVNSQLFADQGNLSHIRKAIHDKSLRWSAGDTSQSKLKPSERRRRLGSKLPLLTDIKRRTASSSISLPSKLDWRDYNGVNYVTPVKEQDVCGACWAFATTAALESNRLIFQNDQTNNLDLSEQTLISCGNAGNCDAGAIDAASDFVSNYGLPPETCYPYQAEDGSCANTCPNWEENAYRIPGWHLVDPTVQSIKYALYYHGPLVALMAVHTDLYYYRSGIYTQTWGDFEGYHAVQIIGYDDADQYFIGKSSWGADWGESGYFKIAYSEVSSAAMFGCWTIAYEKVIPSSFSTIDNVSRSASAVEGGEESSTGTGGADGQSEGRGQSHNGDASGNNGSKTAGSSTLSGTIKDQSGRVIAGAEVKADNLSAKSDDRGVYLFSSIPAGDYVLKVSKKDYSLTIANLNIPKAMTVTKDFILSEAAIPLSGDPLPLTISGSSQMSVNGTQTLSASGGTGPYSWAIAKGGGSISATTGTSTVYTAPSSNSNCVNNPKICVTDSTKEMACMRIVVNAYTSGYPAYRELICGVSGACGWSHNYREYKCSGEMFPVEGTCPAPGGVPTCTRWGPEGAQYTRSWVGYIYGYALDLGDVRDSTMKTNGCCSSQVPDGTFPHPYTNTLGNTSDNQRCGIGSSANLISGNVYHSQEVGPLTLSYNSTDNYDGALGKKWTHNYNRQLIYITDSATKILKTEDGNIIYFRLSGSVYKPEKISGDSSNLVKNVDNTYTQTTKQGIIYNYNTSGKLTSIVDRNGNAITLTYNGADLATITDKNGRTTTITTTSGKITGITDVMNRTYTIGYTDGLLISIAPPPGNGNSWVFDYYPDTGGRMRTKTDPANRTTTYTYYADGKVNTSANTDEPNKTRTIAYNQ